MDLFMQDRPKVTSEVTPQSMYVEYYTHSFFSVLQYSTTQVNLIFLLLTCYGERVFFDWKPIYFT